MTDDEMRDWENATVAELVGARGEPMIRHVVRTRLRQYTADAVAELDAARAEIQRLRMIIADAEVESARLANRLRSFMAAAT